MARRRWWNSIASQVWMMVAACTVFIAAMVFINTEAELSHERSSVGDTLGRKAVTDAGVLRPDLTNNGTTVQTLAGLIAQPAIGEAGPECPAAMHPLQAAVSGGYLAEIGSAGTVLCAAPEVARTGVRTFAGTPALLRMIAAGKPTNDGPFIDPLRHMFSYATVVPLTARPHAALVYVWDTQAGLAPDDADSEFSTLVVDTRTNTVLMHEPALKGVVGTTLQPGALLSAVHRTRSVSSAPDVNGTRMLFRSVPLAGTLRLLVGESQAKAFAPVTKSLRRNIAIGAATVLAMILMGTLLHARITRPVRRLRASIRALAADPDAPPAATDVPTELAVVAEAFNDATLARRRTDGLTRAIVLHSSDHVVVLDEAGTVTFVSPRAQHALGLRLGDGHHNLAEVLHPDDYPRVTSSVRQWLVSGGGELHLDARVITMEGTTRHLDVHAEDLRSDPHVGGIVLTGRDITEHKQLEEHLSHQAMHDALTGLPNRAAVLEHLTTVLDDPDAVPACVCFLDLDRFKLINDSHGHAVGDRVLTVLAKRLENAVRPGDLVGRFGGDEFVVVGPMVDDEHDALAFASRIQQAMTDPLHVDRRDLFVSGSIGIALATTGQSAGIVLRNADTAMYRAKELGRNCVAVFDDEMQAQAQRLLRTESDLHRAVEQNQLLLHFQPVVSLGSSPMVGAEALVRWNHPERGLVSPGDFIPVAEETGLVVPIGEWVLREACAWAAGARERLGRPVRVSVNVSPRQLAQTELVDLVGDAISTSGLDPSCLCLEVTETVLVQDKETAARTLTALHEKGVQVAIDDFGTGWSSLTYLQQFPVDEIKLDRSYVSQIECDPLSATIVGGLIEMAHGMGLSVTAEGVETVLQDEFLRRRGCDTAQGYLYSRPVEAAEAEAFLAVACAIIPSPRGIMER